MLLDLDRNVIRNLTAAFLEAAIRQFKPRTGKDDFTMPDLLGTSWPAECLPFYQLYNGRGGVAGHEMGKLLKVVADRLGLHSQKEDRFGKKAAITRYFYSKKIQASAEEPALA